jgi:hypothetical protein
MIQFPGHLIKKPLIALLFLGIFLAFAASQTLAGDSTGIKEEDKAPVAASSNTTETKPDGVAVEKKMPNVLYAPLKEITFETPENALPVKAEASVPTGQITNVSLSRIVMNTPIAMPKVPPPAAQPLNKIPMTVGEKFTYFFKGAFLSPGAYGQAAFSGIRGEAFDKDHDPNGEKGHFFADAGTRAARSFTFSASAKFFERFFWASIFRQDPRYIRSGKKGAGAKIGYAMSRVFITEGDHGGSQFNISYLGGGASAAFLTRLYEREERRTLNKVLSKWGNHIVLTMVSNIFREFLTGQ